MADGEKTRPGLRPPILATVAASAAAALSAAALAQVQPVTGVTGAHDPSTITKVGSKYFYYATGQGIVSRSSSNESSWSGGPSVFSTQPAWTGTAVPGFTGNFWAPDVIFRNNQYYLYYSVSTFGSQVSAIGVATSPTLDPAVSGYGWTDQGAVIQSNSSVAYNTIDPSLLQDTDGTLWMSFGSFFGGVYAVQLDPTSGKVKAGATPSRIAANNSNNSNTYFRGIEASYLLKHDGFYYLFENWGACCSGITSTYNIRVGRSTSVTGPFVDQNGARLDSTSTAGPGGTLFLGNDGNQIGPGQFSYFNNGTQEQFGYHYYDGNANGAPTEGIRDLFWTADDWPTIAPVNPDWTGASAGNWSTTANWSTGAVPNAAGNIANFGTIASGSHTVTIDGSARTVATINLNSSTSYTIGSAGGFGLTLDTGIAANMDTINVQLGNHTIAAPITANQTLGVNVTQAASTLTLGAVTGSTLQKYGAGTVGLSGIGTFTGNIFVRAGTLDITGAVTASSFNSIGDTAGDVGTMTVRSSGSFTSAGDLNIGDTGDNGTAATGTLNLSGSAQVTVNSGGGFYVGSGFSNNAKASGTVNQSGGTLTANGSMDGGFTLGGRTSKVATGVYNLSGGTVNANTNVWDGGHGTGTMNQTGGTFYATAFVSIGRFSGATGSWTVSTGTLNQTNAADALIVGEAGTGTLTISGSGQVTTAAALKLGQSGGNGTLNLNGGTLVTPAIQTGTGTGTLNFAGGVLKPTASTTTFLPTGTTAKVQGAGAIIDSNGFNITVADPLIHDTALGGSADGGLVKNGAGALTLSGSSTYNGTTNVNAGSLVIATGGAIAGTAVNVAAGAALNVNGSLPAAPSVNDNGAVTFAGNASTTVGFTRSLASLAVNNAATASVSLSASALTPEILNINVLTFTGTGTLDLTNNALTTTAAPAAVRGLLAAGAIYTSHVAANTTLGYTDIGSGQTEIAFTFAGDTNLDGTVDVTDLGNLASAYGQSSDALWVQGDSNYDGTVDVTDLGDMASTYGATLAAGSATGAATPLVAVADTATSAVPEPGTIAWVAALALGSSKRRRTRATRG